LCFVLYICRRIIIRQQPYNEIVPGLYLGRRLSAREAAKLPFKPAGGDSSRGAKSAAATEG
jgi:hypothetical protein